MPKITHYMHAEIDLSKPVPELTGVIAHVLQAWSGKEKEILTELQKEISNHLDVITKKEEKPIGKPLR